MQLSFVAGVSFGVNGLMFSGSVLPRAQFVVLQDIQSGPSIGPTRICNGQLQSPLSIAPWGRQVTGQSKFGAISFVCCNSAQSFFGADKPATGSVPRSHSTRCNCAGRRTRYPVNRVQWLAI